jgi:hypothetical protein
MRETQKKLFEDPAVSASADKSDLTALNLSAPGAAAWNQAKTLFSNLNKNPSNNSLEDNLAFMKQLARACAIEKPSIDAEGMKEIVNFLIPNMGKTNAISDVLCYEVFNKRISLNRDGRPAQADHIQIVEENLENLKALKSGLSDAIKLHERGDDLIKEIDGKIAEANLDLKRLEPFRQ